MKSSLTTRLRNQTPIIKKGDTLFPLTNGILNMKIKLILTTVVYILLVLAALVEQQTSLIADSLIISSTLFYGLYSISIITNYHDVKSKKV